MGDDTKKHQSAETFIARWQGQEGGQERANYALFLTELCDLIGVEHPQPAGATHEHNDYVFERVVTRHKDDGDALGRIDLYKKDCFVLEAKQSRVKGAAKEIIGQNDLFGAETSDNLRGRRGADRAWDVLMLNAKRQAEEYARALPTSHGWPPFILVCDVGHCIEVYADFSGQGKNYTQFPDRQSFRIYLEDLRNHEVRERLTRIWKEPQTLDPTRTSAKVTRDIAKRLAQVSRALEKKNYPAQDVAMFLMRCLFTMFAEDVGLLPEKSFKQVLEDCERNPEAFTHDVGQLWEAMDLGTWAHVLKTKVRKFNGEFFRNRAALPLGREEIGELRQAASYNWNDVDPSIFGTLVEQALDPEDRKRLGAHYTPRAYVERLVVVTIIQPLREDWQLVIAAAENLRRQAEALVKLDRRGADDLFLSARQVVQDFHAKLCLTRVLDPACGTGNFLYVALEQMKRLEGEVIELLETLGGQESIDWLDQHKVDPHQFLGLEINPRAAAIAELVLWIGYLQWHFRTKGGPPDEPILRAFRNIQVRNAVLTWDGDPLPRIVNGRNTYPNARRPDWPLAEFIVGNPPFIGKGAFMRDALGDEQVEALWSAHPQMNESADFVLFWWDWAAELLTRKGTVLRRFGFVTTNSITQVFNRKVTGRHLGAKHPVSIVFAIPDHPWTKATADAASVRIAMTTVEAGTKTGLLQEVTSERELDSDCPRIEFKEYLGKINSDLTIGSDVTAAKHLRANECLSSNGMMLAGAGFIVTPAEAAHLGLGKHEGLEKYVRDYRNGRDLMGRPRGVKVIDLFGLAPEEIRMRFPSIYQHIALTVKPERDINRRESFKQNWWRFGEPRKLLRSFLEGLPRYIATVETSKHRVFQFLSAEILPDHMLIAIGLDDGFYLGVLSSRIHVVWALRTGGWLGVGNDPRYSKSRCFDPFPFPDANNIQKQTIRLAAEELDVHRKRVLAEHAHLTLTGLYNVLERLRAGAKPDDLDEREKAIFKDGHVLILKELHDKIDVAVAVAYGWSVDLSDDEILTRLVTLNEQRFEEEKRGLVRWLRPEYQIPRLATGVDKQATREEGAQVAAELLLPEATQKLSFPSGAVEQTAAVFAALAAAGGPINAQSIASQFKKTKTTEKKIEDVLASLARLGHVTSVDGKNFSLRRAA